MKQLFTLIILLPLFSLSQPGGNYQKNYKDTIPSSYYLDYNKIRDHIIDGVPKKYKDDDYKRLTYTFADKMAYNVSGMIVDGWSYNDWKEMEDYINDVLKKILPDELKSDTAIHAYIKQDGVFNANMTPAGKFFVNIGVFSEVTDEAMLAGVLAHEVAHYYFKHLLKMYMDNETGLFDPGWFSESRSTLISEYSKEDEQQADEQAMIWYRKSGYSINCLKKDFEMLVRFDDIVSSRTYDESKLKNYTHPTGLQRMTKFMEFYNIHKNEPGEKYLVSEDKFNKLKDEAKPEILKHLLNSFDYTDCIEKAFKFHIFQPDNNIYVYYILEGIRRKCYLNSRLWSENFITSRYYDTVRVNKILKKTNMKDHLFSKLNLTILSVDKDEAENIKAKSYWEGSPRFITYEDAFNTFYKVCRLMKNDECILTCALSYTRDTSARNKYLKTYLSKDNILHRDYAQNLLNQSIYSSLSTNKLLVFEGLHTQVRQKSVDVTIRNHCPKMKNEHICILDSLMLNNDKYIPLYLPDLKRYRLNEFRTLSDLEFFSFIKIIAKGEKTELHILDPKYWETLKKYNVDEIVFLNCSLLKEGGGRKTIEDYKYTANLDYNTIFSQYNSERYLNTHISSVREIKDKQMKIHFLGISNKLKSKRSGYGQIIDEIKKQLADEETYAKAIDEKSTKNKK